jgi:hypothetical protein
MDNIQTGCEDVVWIHMTQDRVHWWSFVNTVTILRIPYKARNFSTSRGTISLFSMEIVSFYTNSRCQRNLSLAPSLISTVTLHSRARVQCFGSGPCVYRRVRRCGKMKSGGPARTPPGDPSSCAVPTHP